MLDIQGSYYWAIYFYLLLREFKIYTFTEIQKIYHIYRVFFCRGGSSEPPGGYQKYLYLQLLLISFNYPFTLFPAE